MDKIPLSLWIYCFMLCNFFIVAINLHILGFVSIGWEKEYCFAISYWYLGLNSIWTALYLVTGFMIGDLPSEYILTYVCIGFLSFLLAYTFYRKYKECVRKIFH